MGVPEISTYIIKVIPILRHLLREASQLLQIVEHADVEVEWPINRNGHLVTSIEIARVIERKDHGMAEGRRMVLSGLSRGPRRNETWDQSGWVGILAEPEGSAGYEARSRKEMTTTM